MINGIPINNDGIIDRIPLVFLLESIILIIGIMESIIIYHGDDDKYY
jgi:hypothetical protein